MRSVRDHRKRPLRRQWTSARRFTRLLGEALESRWALSTLSYTAFEPRAIGANSTSPLSLTAVVTGNPTTVRVETRSGGAIFPLTLIGQDTYQVSLPAATVLAGYQQATGHNTFGFLDVFDGSTRTSRTNLGVNVRDATMPDVDVTSLSASAQRSAHVVNMRSDTFWTSGVASSDLVKSFYALLPDAFDFVAVVSQGSAYKNRSYMGVRNNTQGIGASSFDNGSSWGSPSRLQGIVNFPIDAYFDLGETAANHEIGHRWCCFLDHPALALGTPHWPISDFARGVMGMSTLGGQGLNQPYNFVEQPDGTFLVQFSPLTNEFSELDLYLMGLAPAANVPSGRVFLNQNQLGQLHHGGILQGPIDTVTIDEIIASDGPRVPAFGNSQTEFRMATIVLSSGRLLSDEEMAVFDYLAARGEFRTEIPYVSGLVGGMTKPFYVATKGKGTLRTAIANDIVLSKRSAGVSEFGAAESFTVALTSPPTSNVVLNIGSGDTSEVTVEPASLTFTAANWSTPQIVTIRGVDDELADGNQTTTVTVSVVAASSDDGYDLAESRIVSVTTTDDDIQPPTVASTTPPLAGIQLAAGAGGLQVAFSEPVIGGAAAGSFELRNAGADGLLGNTDDQFISLSANYAGTTSTLSFAGLAQGSHRLTVKGTITDSDGSRLDGDGNGGAGGDWVRDFVVAAPGLVEKLVIAGTPVDDMIRVDAPSGSVKKVLVTVNGVQSGPFVPAEAVSIYGLAGNDTITVSPEVFIATVIDGGPGLDLLNGGSGDDKFFSRERELDRIDAGLGIDEATTDSVDKVLGIESQNPMPRLPDNATQHVKVLVINFDPLVPSEGNRRLYEIFNWNNPRDLAAGYEADIERASGGAIQFDIVEWRDLNEIPAFRDGFRYTPDQYVQARRSGRNEDFYLASRADFPRIVREQDLAPLIDSGQVDELWLFGDHFFNLPGESWMSGPGAFFINGYEEGVPTQRAFASMGFSYERGWSEMLHNHGHRTEFTMNRFHGGMQLVNPMSNWSKFSANAGQCWFGCAENIIPNEPTGIGTTHRPANAAGDYDTGNPRVVQSWADDFLNFPNLSGATIPVSRETWADENAPDYERGYQRWYFNHLPRAPGVNAADQRQNNWWKYLYDFNNYTPDGQPLPLRASVRASDIFNLGDWSYTFDVAYSSAVPVDIQSLGIIQAPGYSNIVVTGPNGYSQAATLMSLSDATNDTYVVARYILRAPGDTWDVADRGQYSIRLKSQQVRDALGTALAGGTIGAFAVRTAAAAELANDGDTSLLLRFNQSLNGVGGETPSVASGETFAAGRIGDAVQWTNGRLEYPAAGNISAAGGTVEFWIKPTWSPNQGNYRFFQIGNEFNNSMVIGVDGANNLRFIQWGDDPATPGIESHMERGLGWGVSNWTANSWHHVAATWDRAAGTMALFVDGQLLTSGPAVSISAFAGNDVIIGSAPNGTVRSLAAFDEVRISSRARSAGEISADYRTGLQILGLTIDAGSGPLTSDAPRQLKATATTDSPLTLDVTRDVRWSSSNANVVSVAWDGIARANLNGNSQITATLDALTANQAIVSQAATGVVAWAETIGTIRVNAGVGQQAIVIQYFPTAPGLAISDLNMGDIRIRGPRGFSTFPLLLSPGDPATTPRLATYQFAPPGGYWDSGDNGEYDIELMKTQVKDTGGRPTLPHTVIGSFQLTVNPVDDVPSIAPIIEQWMTEDGTLNVGVEIDDLETPVGELLVSAQSDNVPLISGLVLSGNGGNRSLQVIPVSDRNGAAQVTLTVSDGQNSVQSVFNVTVTPLNDPPSFNNGDDQSVTDESGPQSIFAWATAIAAGPPDEVNQPLYFSVHTDNTSLFVVQPEVDVTGELTYVPARNVSGTANVTVTLWEESQPGGGPNEAYQSLPQTFAITIDKTHRWFNARNALDVNDSRETFAVSAIDALIILNLLNANVAGGNIVVPADSPIGPFYYDTSRDNFVSAIDALRVFNFLNSPAAQAEGEGENQPFAVASEGQEDTSFENLLAMLAADGSQARRKRRPE